MRLGTGSYIHDDAYTNRFNGEVNIGNYTSIAAGCTFLSGWQVMHGQSDRRNVSNYLWSHHDRGPINIGHDVWIATNVTILPGVTIGNGAIVGASCLVSKSVEPYDVVVGNPQRIIRKRFDTRTVEALQRISWWDWPHEKIMAELPYFADIDAFVERHKVR